MMPERTRTIGRLEDGVNHVALRTGRHSGHAAVLPQGVIMRFCLRRCAHFRHTCQGKEPQWMDVLLLSAVMLPTHARGHDATLQERAACTTCFR